MTVGDKIKELRGRAGMSQPQLAERAGVHVHSLRSYEAGRRGDWFPLSVAVKLADALGVSVEEFAQCVRPKKAKK